MSEQFDRAAAVSDVPLGTIKIVKLWNMEVALANIDGRFFAMPNKCTHQGGPVGRGKLIGSVVQCPWHGSKFDFKTGAVVQGPAEMPEKMLELKVENDSVWVKKP